MPVASKPRLQSQGLVGVAECLSLTRPQVDQVKLVVRWPTVMPRRCVKACHLCSRHPRDVGYITANSDLSILNGFHLEYI